MSSFSFPEFLSDWHEVITSNPLQVEKKIRAIQTSNLAIVTDFDRTLTTHLVDGRERPTLIGTLRATGVLSPDYTFSAYCLYDHFYPIEVDVSRTREDRAGEMTRWWDAHLYLLSGKMTYREFFEIVGRETIEKRLSDEQYNYSEEQKVYWRSQEENTAIIPVELTRSIIEQAIHSGIVRLRSGIERVFQKAFTNNIPIVIFSANALGTDPIESYLASHSLMLPNVHIVSNAFTWTDGGVANGYREPVIHSFNKSISGIRSYPDIYRHIQDKKTLLLLGDSLGDANMADGHDAETVLKIGFLTKPGENLDDQKKAYSEVFDIVFVGDGNLVFLEKFLDAISLDAENTGDSE